MSKTRCSYHHGDLRNALIVAAAELIERDGTLDFTMAEAAARAGVQRGPVVILPIRKNSFAESVNWPFWGWVMRQMRPPQDIPTDRSRHSRNGPHVSGLRAGQACLFFGSCGRTGAILRSGERKSRKSTAGSWYWSIWYKRSAMPTATHRVNSLHLATQIWSMGHGITLEANQLINLFDRSIEPEALLDQSVRTMLAGVVGAAHKLLCRLFYLAPLIRGGILRSLRP